MDNSEACYGDDALHVGNGIIHLRSCPHTSEQNGFVERHNRHVVETGLTLLAQACWRQAMKEEYDALMKNKTWSLVPHAFNTNVVDGNNKGTIDNIISQLRSAFILKDLGPFNYFLGIEIVPYVSDILLSQKKYILKLLQSVGLSNCNPISSPMVTLSSLSLNDNTAFSNPVKYRQVVGNLDTSLEAFLDADQTGDLDDRWSTRGFDIYLGSNLISWTARKQHTVSHSSKETEYKALADTVAELTWIQALLYELGIRSSSTPILWCDNLGSTYLSANPIFCARTKQVEIDYHFVREKVAKGDLRV
ncbi:gag/pol polyprotein [Tanacetum coccineum]|uniref:Gag/pol polyprotein n=1 Tax=Tanacetum coccineum TaxID=301880 RepID=A0ABQ5JDU7_9ASTR